LVFRFPYLFLALAGPCLAVAPACHRRARAIDAAAVAAVDVPRATIPTAASVRDTIAARGTHLALLYGSNLFAEYENCGCPSHPLGGLARRASVIDRARADADGVLVVDAGDMLMPAVFHDAARIAPATTEVERRARLILEAYARMGVEAVLPAERDLAVGIPRLRRWLTELHIPAVASNLFNPDGSALFERDRIITVAGLAVGIFGVVAPLPEDDAQWKSWPVRVREPAAVAREEIASLRRRGASIIVALVHLGSTDGVRQLLEAAPGIDWAVQGHTQMQLETVDKVGSARRLEAFSLGKLVGRVDIHVIGGSFELSDRGDRAQVATILDDHRRQLTDLDRRSSEAQTDGLRAYYRMRREGLLAAMKRETVLLQHIPAMIRGSWFENRLIPLDESIPDHPGVAFLVQAYNAQSIRRAASGLPVGVVWRSAGDAAARPATEHAPTTAPPRVAPLAYAGSLACARCHAAAWQHFQTTKHAHALASLAKLKRDRDPTCVVCHATGYFLPGGTTRIAEATGTFKDVGCESCHGGSRAHATAQAPRATPLSPANELTCRGCHTPDQTNGEFAYPRFLAAILGPGHGRVTTRP
jgi:Cytochrome c554 and c-prime